MTEQAIIIGGVIPRWILSEVQFIVGDVLPEAFKVLVPQVDLLYLLSRGLVRRVRLSVSLGKVV